MVCIGGEHSVQALPEDLKGDTADMASISPNIPLYNRSVARMRGPGSGAGHIVVGAGRGGQGCDSYVRCHRNTHSGMTFVTIHRRLVFLFVSSNIGIEYNI